MLGRLAAEKFIGAKPDSWTVKEIDGDTDFGIDYFIQLRDVDGFVKYNFLAQLKGTKDPKKIKEDCIKVELKASTLNYYANQGLVMIIVCDLVEESFYYEYLHSILYKLNGNKRYLSEPPKTYTISISKSNKLEKSLDISGVVEEHSHGIYRITRASLIEHQSNPNRNSIDITPGSEFERKRDISVDQCTFSQGYVSIHSMLPSKRDLSISCFIWLNLPSLTGASIGLNEQQVLEQLFTGYRSKADDPARKWFISKVKSGFAIKISGVMLTVPNEVIFDISDILDDLMDTYVERISEIEEAIESQRYPIANHYSNAFKLVKIRRGLWSAILDFARAHPIESNGGSWDIFGHDQYSLRVHLKNKPFHWAGNIIISPEQDSLDWDYRISNENVVIVWNGLQEYEISEATSSVEHVHSWLINELLPAVIVWSWQLKGPQTQSKNSGWVKRFLDSFKSTSQVEMKPVYAPEKYVARDYRVNNYGCIEPMDFKQLSQHINDMQHFFHLNQNVYFETGGIISLYQGLIHIITDTEEFDTKYIAGNLGIYYSIPPSELTKDDIINFLLESIENLEEGTTNSFRLDLILRCYQFLLDRSERLDQLAVKNIISCLSSANSLMTFMNVLEKRRLASA